MTNTYPNHFIDNVDLLIALFLVASGVGTLTYVVNPAAMGLGGSLIGAGIGLVGHWFNRLYQRLAKNKKDAAEIRKIKALVTSRTSQCVIRLDRRRADIGGTRQGDLRGCLGGQ